MTFSNFFSLFYLSTLPLILFSGLPLNFLIVSIALGIFLFYLFQKPSLKLFIVFLGIVLISMLLISPRFGIDMGLLNAINSQRGEHPNYQANLIAKILHNKSELVHSFIANLDRLLSPSAIFASGFWHHLSSYYPLGYLFPWDIYFIYRYFVRRKNTQTGQSWIYFALSLMILILLSGFIYLDQAIIFSFGIVYFLAFLALYGYLDLSKRAKITFLVLNSLFLTYQILVTSHFKI